MPNRKPSLFLTPPSLGGKLTLVNANFWVIVVLLVRSNSIPRDLPNFLEYASTGLMIVMGLPLGCLLPVMVGPPGLGSIMFLAVVLGLNSFIWGYGLAWIIDLIGRFFRDNL